MNFSEYVGRLLGYKDVTSIEEIRPSFAAPWMEEGPGWLIFGCIGLAATAVYFYLRFQARGHFRGRMALAVVRASVLGILLLILADPILEIRFTSQSKPLFWVLFDGTESMSLSDALPTAERARLAEAVGLKKPASSGSTTLPTDQTSRIDYLRTLLSNEDKKLLKKLNEKFRLRAYLFDRPDGVRDLPLVENSRDEFDPAFLTEQLTTTGQVTAIGNAFDDLARRQSTHSLAGVLVVSDFAQNAGKPPLGAAEKLDVPIFTLGIGARSALDVAIDIQAPLKMKKAEKTAVQATLRHQELEGKPATVRVTARRVGLDQSALSLGEEILVGEQTLALSAPYMPIDFPFTPEESGRYEFTASVEAIEGEVLIENNRASREATVIDDFLRLLFVEYEPTWEWRFVKEVFHRDRLVGLRGFRTYLRSSDPAVRESNELFMPSLTLPRNEFFQHDVLFLGDMPASTLSSRFCELTKEFVSQFGGGLVIVSGPRFGPKELAQTPLADMLPVIVDPDLQLRDEQAFTLQRSPMASQYDFMRLGRDDAENEHAWQNLGSIPWYQPVRRLERTSTILAQHPTDTCADGKTPQPLIAIRKYGRGEVVYIAFNEMWRLRRKYGEQYYRQFWGQLIHRLGLSHALGAQKRFVVRTDRQQYQADDPVLITVEAFNKEFEPLTESELEEKTLQGELVLPVKGTNAEPETKPLRIAELRPGIFESRVPVFEGGEYRVRVTDPVTDEKIELPFHVMRMTAERRSAVRNVSLQKSLASVHPQGKSYELDTVDQLLEEFNPPRLTETRVEVFPLWNTWLCFLLVVSAMLVEWFFRKTINLA